ncbi:nuclear RNA export factor 2 [Anopheles nili]|uniref:nuclear RNA export factor 2 n=1 Tax=Anopheles nili TaxID=185578 RepID=UPI00237C16AC|nr:nuclear RNA export factor 2 [Anopheles nili]
MAIETTSADRIASDQNMQEHDENSFYNVHSMSKQKLVMRTGELGMEIEPKLASQLYNESNLQYDQTLLNRVDVWHQVMVHHDNNCSKQKVLEILFNAVPTSDFFPVAYRRYVNLDFFMIRMCTQALMKLFEGGLKLKSGQTELPISVRLGAARFCSGQIFPRQVIEKAVKERCDNATQYGNMNMLNLDCFAAHSYVDELCINLGNRTQFEAVCSVIGNVLSEAAHINTLRLSNNGISHISLLAGLKANQLVSLDLRGNRIKHPSLLRHLRELPLLELYVADNGLTEVPDHQKLLCTFFPKLLKLDSNLIQTQAVNALYNVDDVEEVEITSPGTLLTASDLNLEAFQKYQMSPNWHLMTVHHGGTCNKQDILDALLNLLDAHQFFPCYYKTYSKRDEFLVKSCFKALKILVNQKLKLPIPSRHTVLTLSLAMNVAVPGDRDVKPLKKLEHFVSKRFHLGNLDLCSMQTALNEYKFVDFRARSRSTLDYMINYAAEKYSASCFVLRLRHNELQNCMALTSLSKFKKLVSLDLRFNSLAKISDLRGIPYNTINEVFLDNNPLCSTVSSSVDYVQQVKKYFSMLQQLDGSPLVGNFSVFQNYICTPEAYKFAEMFVQHYFSLYDSFERDKLHELYHSKAQFSMTCGFDINQSVPLNPLQQAQANYNHFSRNILQFNGNTDRSMSMLILGNERIGCLLMSFPSTVFDLYSFHIDVPIFTPDHVLITVHGRLKEGESSLLSQSLGFTRTWLIKPCGKGKHLFENALEYKIHNDMLHLYSTTDQENEIPSNGNEAKQNTDAQKDAPLSDGDDRTNALIVLQELTRLDHQWATRCLEESSWNLKLALNVFLKLYESKRIPPAAFVDGAS